MQPRTPAARCLTANDGRWTGSTRARPSLDLTPVFGRRRRGSRPPPGTRAVRDKLYSAPFQSRSALLYANRKLMALTGDRASVADVKSRETGKQGPGRRGQ